jgi:hypothetical protein
MDEWENGMFNDGKKEKSTKPEETPKGIAIFQSPLLRATGFILFPLILSFAPSLLLHHFFLLPSTLTPHHKRLDLYTMIFSDERRVALFFSPFIHLCLSMTYVWLLQQCSYFS